MAALYEEEINELQELRASALINKHSYREEWGQSKAQLTVYMAKYINSSASFDNKLLGLLKIDDIAEEVTKLSNSFINDEILFKKYRDMDSFYLSKIIEFQSRRKSEYGMGV